MRMSAWQMVFKTLDVLMYTKHQRNSRIFGVRQTKSE